MKKRGFTLIEVLVSIGIMVLLSIAVLFIFGDRSREYLSKDRENLVSIIEEARSLSMSSKNGSKYGVYLENSKATLFLGENYIPNDPSNKIQNLNSALEISSINLNGGGSQIVFSRFNGETNNYGNFVLSLKNDPLSSTTIYVLPSGVLE